jgi:hypothetical protein
MLRNCADSTPENHARRRRYVKCFVWKRVFDTPGDGYYFVLHYNGRPLEEQLQELGLKDGDAVMLREADCGDYTVEATLLFAYKHPMTIKPALWAREKSKSN